MAKTLAISLLSALAVISGCGAETEEEQSTSLAELSDINYENYVNGTTIAIVKSIVAKATADLASSLLMGSGDNGGATQQKLSFSLACTTGGTVGLDVSAAEGAQSIAGIPAAGVVNLNLSDCGLPMQGATQPPVNGSIVMDFSGLDLQRGLESSTVNLDVNALGLNFTGTNVCKEYGADCLFSSSLLQADVNYRVEDSKAAVNFEENTYAVTTKLFYGNEGYVEVTAGNIFVNEEGYVCSGVASLKGSPLSAPVSIEFPSCDIYIATFNGVATTYNQ